MAQVPCIGLSKPYTNLPFGVLCHVFLPSGNEMDEMILNIAVNLVEYHLMNRFIYLEGLLSISWTWRETTIQ